MKTVIKRIAIAAAVVILGALGLLAVFTAGSAGAQGATTPHCARTQELCNVVEYITIQPDGTHKVWTCYLNDAAATEGRSIRFAIYTCRTP